MSETKNEKLITDEKDLNQKFESMPTGEGNSTEKTEGISSSSPTQKTPIIQINPITTPTIPNTSINSSMNFDPVSMNIFPASAANWTNKQKAIFLATIAVKSAGKNKNLKARDFAKLVDFMSKARTLFQSVD
ncbi:MAG: hypothetical protein Fur0024_3940 [Patescibacteria group bacterium]